MTTNYMKAGFEPLTIISLCKSLVVNNASHPNETIVGREAFSSTHLILKNVAEACAADDVLGVGAQFLAQARNVDVDGAVCDHDSSPH